MIIITCAVAGVMAVVGCRDGVLVLVQGPLAKRSPVESTSAPATVVARIGACATNERR